MNNTNDIMGASVSRVQTKLCDKRLSTELSNDYTLPDYQPEIRRVLRVNATVLPAAKYVSGSQAELNGTVDYRLLYVASDGKIYSAPLSSEYALSAPLDIASNVELGEGVIILCDVSTESITARVSGPRRLTIKCRLASQLRAYGTMTLDDAAKDTEERTERLVGVCSAEYVTSAMSETQELTADINTLSDTIRVIDASAELFISDVKAFEGYAECKGETVLNLLVCDENADSEPKVLTQKLQFEDKIEIESATEASCCTARGFVSDLNVTVDEGNILCVMSVFAEVTARENRSVTYTKDVYSTQKSCETAYTTYSIPYSLCCISSNFSQSERIELEEGATLVNAKAINCNCEATVESCAYENGKYSICGKCKYAILAKKEEEYLISEQVAPFKYEFNGNEPHSEFRADVYPQNCSVRIDGSTLALDCELSVNAELSATKEITALSDAFFGEELKKEGGDIILCYPTPDDTLWSISKRYAVPTLSLPNVSNPEEKLTGISYLVVNL